MQPTRIVDTRPTSPVGITNGSQPEFGIVDVGSGPSTLLVSPNPANVAPGGTLQLTTQLQNASGASVTPTGSVTWTSARPSIATVRDIGPSWTWQKTGGAQGYRMRVLRLNNAATDATVPNKPNMVVLAAIHAREYTTAELTTRFAEWLVKGYGTDPEATWMLDNFRFHFLLQANPDGRKKAESGISWRKNTDTDNGT